MHISSSIFILRRKKYVKDKHSRKHNPAGMAHHRQGRDPLLHTYARKKEPRRGGYCRAGESPQRGSFTGGVLCRGFAPACVEPPMRGSLSLDAYLRDLKKTSIPARFAGMLLTSLLRGVTRNRTGDTRIFSPLLYQLSYDTIVLCLQVGCPLVCGCKGMAFS